MVRGLVEQQDVGLLNEKAAERDTAALAPGEQVDLRIGRRAPERVHCDLELGLDLPPIGGLDLLLELALALEEVVHLFGGHLLGKSFVHFLVCFEKVEDFLSPFLNDFFDGGAGRELRLLLEITDAIAFGEAHLADIVFVDSGDDAQKRALARAVQSEDTNLCAVKEGKIDVLQDLAFRRMDAPHADERKNDLFVVCHYRNRCTSKNIDPSSQVAPPS